MGPGSCAFPITITIELLRNMKLKSLFFIIFLVLSVEAVSARVVVDQAGRRVNVPDHPQRIVSLAPSITEIIFSLSADDKLKGATQYSDYPFQAKALPRVGSYVRLDLEKIVALKPDLCFGIRDGNPKHLVDKIEGLGIPVYVIDPRDIKGIMEAIKGVGDVLGAKEQAADLIGDMGKRLDRVKEIVAGSNLRPRVFFQVDAAPIITAGTNTFTHELINIAGGINLGAGAVPYPRYSWEQVLSLQPEVVIVTSMAGGHSPEKLIAEWRQWPQLPAVRNNRIHVVDANLFDRPTARLINGLEVLAGIIHPELYEVAGGR